MGDLYRVLKSRVDANARRSVETFGRELFDYAALDTQTATKTALLDFAVILRRRTIELAAEDRPFEAEDLAYLAAVGEERAALGVSYFSLRRVLLLHATYTLREVHEATGPLDIDDLMQMLRWLGPQGQAAQSAYTEGYLAGQARFQPLVARVRALTELLLSDDPAAPEFAATLGLAHVNEYVVTVIRTARGSRSAGAAVVDRLIDAARQPTVMPMRWQDLGHEAGELVALVPAGADAAAAEHRALLLARDFAEAIGQPCSVGSVVAPVHAMAAATALARRVSVAAPLQRIPSRAYTVADVFVELGATEVPQVDEWLRDVARCLSGGPALVSTLDAYYQHDMSRTRSAASLYIHPRTLDYRLQRVRELTGIDPSSTRGVRVLSAAVARILAGS